MLYCEALVHALENRDGNSLLVLDGEQHALHIRVDILVRGRRRLQPVERSVGEEGLPHRPPHPRRGGGREKQRLCGAGNGCGDRGAIAETKNEARAGVYKTRAR